MINVYIDEFTPCLKDGETGELVDTEVIRIKRPSFLRKYNKRNGWYVNWNELLEENEIWALVIHGSVDMKALAGIYLLSQLIAPWLTVLAVRFPVLQQTVN